MSTLSEELRAHLAEIGRRGGKRRAERMTPEERLKSSRKASKAAGRVHRAKKKARAILG